MTLHDLKIWPAYFEDIQAGRKTFEIRKNDREFRFGDRLHLMEWDPQTKDYTGRSVTVEVTYLSDLTPIGLLGCVGMAIRLVTETASTTKGQPKSQPFPKAWEA